MKIYCGGVVSHGRFHWTVERSKVVDLGFMNDFCAPVIAVLSERHSVITRRIISRDFSITAILRVRTNAEVCFSVVQTISVYMVNDLALVRPNNLPMHQNRFLLWP